MSNLLTLETVSDLKRFAPSYLRLVRDNMRLTQSNLTPTVQFGLTGTGQSPNYQTCFSNGKKIARHGNSPKHKQYRKSEQFEDSNISRPFTYQEIQQAIAQKS